MKIKETKMWNSMDVRNMCIRENFYTAGYCSEYNKMLQYVDNHKEPESIDIYNVAKDILEHTNIELQETIENIMFIIANDVIKSIYEIEE